MESNPFLVISYIYIYNEGHCRLMPVSCYFERHLCIRTAYPQDIAESLMKKHDSQEFIPVAAICIPSSAEQSIVPVTPHISLRGYLVDIIANELGFDDGANVMISRYGDG